MRDAQIVELLLQALETETGGTQIMRLPSSVPRTRT